MAISAFTLASSKRPTTSSARNPSTAACPKPNTAWPRPAIAPSSATWTTWRRWSARRAKA